MKKNSSIFLLILLGAFIFSSCYKEGPVISLTSKKKRVAGVYLIDKYFIDGADSTAEFNIITTNGSVYKYNFQNDKNGQLDGGGCAGYWRFANCRKKINIAVNYIAPSPPNFIPNTFVNKKSNDWEIRRLTTQDLWIKITINNKTYEIRFKK